MATSALAALYAYVNTVVEALFVMDHRLRAAVAGAGVPGRRAQTSRFRERGVGDAAWRYRRRKAGDAVGPTARHDVAATQHHGRHTAAV